MQKIFRLLPVCSLLFGVGCAPKAAVSTKVPNATETTEAPKQASPTNQTQPEHTEEVFTFVEQSPQFPGGESAMLDFIKKNIQYPQEARDKQEEGKVMVQFVVMKDGQIKNATVLRGVSPSIDNEALRVVSLMPRWNPGKQNGRPVNVRFVLPISFMLN